MASYFNVVFLSIMSHERHGWPLSAACPFSPPWLATGRCSARMSCDDLLAPCRQMYGVSLEVPMQAGLTGLTGLTGLARLARLAGQDMRR